MITIGEIKNKFDAEVCDCQTTEQAQDIKVRYLGKSGELTALLKRHKKTYRPKNVLHSEQR